MLHELSHILTSIRGFEWRETQREKERERERGDERIKREKETGELRARDERERDSERKDIVIELYRKKMKHTKEAG